MTRDQNVRTMFFLAGVSIGAAIGMMLAPAAGADLRRKLAENAPKGREFLSKTRDLYEEGRRLADEAAQMFEDGRRLVRG